MRTIFTLGEKKKTKLFLRGKYKKKVESLVTGSEFSCCACMSVTKLCLCTQAGCVGSDTLSSPVQLPKVGLSMAEWENKTVSNTKPDWSTYMHHPWHKCTKMHKREGVCLFSSSSSSSSSRFTYISVNKENRALRGWAFLLSALIA